MTGDGDARREDIELTVRRSPTRISLLVRQDMPLMRAEIWRLNDMYAAATRT